MSLNSSSKKRTRYTEEFRADAVRLVLDVGLPVARVARDLGMHPNTLPNWESKARSDEDGADHRGLGLEEREELKRLRRENRILREEREILKKAAAFFARESR